MSLNGTSTIVNPTPHGTCRVSAELRKETFDFFFRHVFAGVRGPREAMICIFFEKLYDQCHLEGILPVWDEMNDERVADILNRMNFHPVDAQGESKLGEKREITERD